MKTSKFVRLTREELKSKMMFDTKDNIKMFKSICEEILKETCKWTPIRHIIHKECRPFFIHASQRPKFEMNCPYCGKLIEEAKP
jgi:hypothetical protein